MERYVILEEAKSKKMIFVLIISCYEYPNCAENLQNELYCGK